MLFKNKKDILTNNEILKKCVVEWLATEDGRSWIGYSEGADEEDWAEETSQDCEPLGGSQLLT